MPQHTCDDGGLHTQELRLCCCGVATGIRDDFLADIEFGFHIPEFVVEFVLVHAEQESISRCRCFAQIPQNRFDDRREDDWILAPFFCFHSATNDGVLFLMDHVSLALHQLAGHHARMNQEEATGGDSVSTPQALQRDSISLGSHAGIVEVVCSGSCSREQGFTCM